MLSRSDSCFSFVALDKGLCQMNTVHVNVPGCPNQGEPWKKQNQISQISMLFLVVLCLTFSRESHAAWLLKLVTHLWLICTKFKTTADNVNEIPNQSVKQICVKKHSRRKVYECLAMICHASYIYCNWFTIYI